MLSALMTNLVTCREARGYLTTESEGISLPIKFCSLLSVSYVLGATVFIHNYDSLWGDPGSEISLFDSLYFTYISITTIGLGDVMPNNAPVSYEQMRTFPEYVFQNSWFR